MVAKTPCVPLMAARAKVGDVEKGVGEAAPDTRADTARFALRVVQLVFFAAALACGVLGVFYIVSSDYTPPPVPVAHVLANVLVLPGAAVSLSSVAALAALLGAFQGCSAASAGAVTRTSFSLVWGVGLFLFGWFRFWQPHPHQLGACPCPPFHARLDGVCVACPGYVRGQCDDDTCVCGEHGACSEITAACSCDPNWALGANGTCTECSARAIDGPRGACTRCSARFKPDANGDCTLCRNGYIGAECMECHPNFAPRRNDSNALLLDADGAEICTPVRGCKDDQPVDGGRVGPMCEAVPADKLCSLHGDVGATVRRQNNKVPLPATFSSTGITCDYSFECPSYACLGYCAYGKGGPVEGALCREDADCLGGVCESRTCGVEYLVGEDDCACSRSGYLAPRCEKCPGFNGVWSASVCGGRGTCAARYLDDGRGYLSVYSHLECMCAKPAGVLEDYPRWAGAKCQKKVDADGQIVGCAPGFFTKNDCASTCPAPGGDSSASWGGIGACDGRGTCRWNGKEPECQCDNDQRPGGNGWFVNSMCTQCQDSFYGINCQPCARLSRSTSCDNVNDIFKILEGTQCFKSCNVGQECRDTKLGDGFCEVV